ncbi:hypothetical protein ACE1TF_20020, partial [Geomicrobium sp. JSM 1781026]|uniref:hypothetical protein n=1 Tax=Geomicrobium sp. JSM 1781026 TaxID=3344580 RepID=UPI0035C05D0F
MFKKTFTNPVVKVFFSGSTLNVGVEKQLRQNKIRRLLCPLYLNLPKQVIDKELRIHAFYH